MLRFGRQRERSGAIQITQLLVLSSSGPAYTVCKAANKSLYKMLCFSQCLFFTLKNVLLQFCPATHMQEKP